MDVGRLWPIVSILICLIIFLVVLSHFCRRWYKFYKDEREATSAVVALRGRQSSDHSTLAGNHSTHRGNHSTRGRNHSTRGENNTALSENHSAQSGNHSSRGPHRSNRHSSTNSIADNYLAPDGISTVSARDSCVVDIKPPPYCELPPSYAEVFGNVQRNFVGTDQVQSDTALPR